MRFLRMSSSRAKMARTSASRLELASMLPFDTATVGVPVSKIPFRLSWPYVVLAPREPGAVAGRASLSEADAALAIQALAAHQAEASAGPMVDATAGATTAMPLLETMVQLLLPAAEPTMRL